jgi:UDP-N-acetylmuramoylalanine--D-glutamate ligase
LLEQKVSHLILIGEAAERMAAELAGTCEIIFAADLAEAVQQASIVVGQGGTVVLSPACSSYDMFPNYEVRGDCFEQLVLQLTDKQGPS